MVVGGISVKRCLRQGRSSKGCAITVTLVTAAIEVERGGEQTEGVDLVTGLEGAEL